MINTVARITLLAMVALRARGCYNNKRRSSSHFAAVVPLQTHGCYNAASFNKAVARAVVPLQTHGCYNGDSHRAFGG